MIHTYSPEMGQKTPVSTIEKKVGHLTVLKQKEIEMKLSIGHYGDYYIDTIQELKGRGIKKISDGYFNNHEFVKKNKYKVTDLALSKLEKIYDMKREVMLD